MVIGCQWPMAIGTILHWPFKPTVYRSIPSLSSYVFKPFKGGRLLYLTYGATI